MLLHTAHCTLHTAHCTLQGLFPSNFVTLDLDGGEGRGERKRSVAFNEEVTVRHLLSTARYTSATNASTLNLNTSDHPQVEVKEVEQVTFPTQETIDQVAAPAPPT